MVSPQKPEPKLKMSLFTAAEVDFCFLIGSFSDLYNSVAVDSRPLQGVCINGDVHTMLCCDARYSVSLRSLSPLPPMAFI